MRKHPAHVYYARWVKAQVWLINTKGYWTEELVPIDRRWWAWHHRNQFPDQMHELKQKQCEKEGPREG